MIKKKIPNLLFKVTKRRVYEPAKIIGYADRLTLCPAEEQVVPPAIFHEQHLARFLKANPYFTLEGEYKRLFATQVDHDPTLAIPLKKSSTYDFGVITQSKQLIPRNVRYNKAATYDKEPLKKAVLVDHDYCDQFFGHWIHDEMPTALIELDSEPVNKISLHSCNFMHASGYLDLLKPNIRYNYRGTVDDLYFLSDYSQNSYKQLRYQELRKRLNDALNCQNSQYSGVYIARGNSGTQRSLVNEQELIAHLSKKGFDIIHPEKLSPSEVVQRLWNTPLVISVEGSAVAHCLLPMAKHAGVILLQPPERICHSWKGILDAKFHPYAFYVCEPVKAGSFRIDSFDDLDRLIDRTSAKSASM